MVSLNRNAQSILEHYINRYVDYRRQGEYGTSSFWNWYYQVRNYIYQLDSTNSPIGSNLSFSMPNWGTIIFSRSIIDGEVYVLVTSLKINRTNFFNWIRYNLLPSRTPQPSPSQSITSWDFDSNYEPYGGIYVVVSNNGLYSLADKNKELLIDKWFERITFPKVKEIQGFSTVGEGFASPFNYLIGMELKVLHPAEVAIRNRRKIEYKQHISRIITEAINNYLRKNLLLAS